jgi:hypothetical protein
MLDTEIFGSGGSKMGTLIFICPGTRQTFSTGIEIDPASFLHPRIGWPFGEVTVRSVPNPTISRKFLFTLKRDGRSHLLSLLQDTLEIENA